MSILTEYREQLGRSKVALAKEAGLSPQIIIKAEDGSQSRQEAQERLPRR